MRFGYILDTGFRLKRFKDLVLTDPLTCRILYLVAKQQTEWLVKLSAIPQLNPDLGMIIHRQLSSHNFRHSIKLVLAISDLPSSSARPASSFESHPTVVPDSSFWRRKSPTVFTSSRPSDTPSAKDKKPPRRDVGAVVFNAVLALIFVLSR